MRPLSLTLAFSLSSYRGSPARAFPCSEEKRRVAVARSGEDPR